MPAQIKSQPANDLGLIVVIPCFNETNLFDSLSALKNCAPPQCSVEVIVVVNNSADSNEMIKQLNLATYKDGLAWGEQNTTVNLKFYFLLQNELPAKQAGVGLARKIGMDEAVARFDQIGRDGVICCFDADSLCDENYLVEIENHFKQYPKSPGCSIYFEHPLIGNQFEKNIYQGILNYELHLRYYKRCLQFCKLPYAYHTVGSSMAVRSSAYQKQGGMNKRKAGEDFYFLHKIIQLGNFSELQTTRIIPSPRISDRVPFGTGKAIGDWINSNQHHFYTYNFSSFLVIRDFVDLIPELYIHEFKTITKVLLLHNKFQVLFDFLTLEKFDAAIVEIKKNSTDITSFTNRFFRWFDAFRVLKLVHYLRDHQFPTATIEKESAQLLSKIISLNQNFTGLDLLQRYRELDRN